MLAGLRHVQVVTQLVIEVWVATEHENLAAQRLYSACGADAADDVLLFTFRLAPGSDTADADTEHGSAHLPLFAHIHSATAADAEIWLGMWHALWPEGSAAAHRAEIEEYFTGRAAEPQEVLLAVNDAGCPLGLAELSLRAYAEDCTTSPVAYLEGWYVAPDARRRGGGCHLIAAAEDWGRRQGCSELASDTTLDNTVSAAAHRAAGFEDAQESSAASGRAWAVGRKRRGRAEGCGTAPAPRSKLVRCDQRGALCDDTDEVPSESPA